MEFSLLLPSPDLCLYVYVFLVFFCYFTFAFTSNETDLNALFEFKAKITEDPFQVLSSWNHTIHFCQWQGITCSRLHQRVTEIDLQSLKLAGSISPYIGNLTFLRKLNLINNSFSSQIPKQISHLRRLERLGLSNNSISGKIPTNISRCSKLIVVRLAHNMLEGDIPAEFGSLSKLQDLYLFRNYLSGAIPHSLGNLSQLQILSLTFNDLAGTIPHSLGQLRSLESLQLFSNRLSGTIPPSVFNLSSLGDIDMGMNHFHGNLPSELGLKLPNVSYFSIAENKFTGQIPSSLSNATNLEYLFLSGNNLTGQVPSLHKLNKLRRFIITLNYLGNGNSSFDLSFLESLTNATMLEDLDINGNNFGGMIPQTICNLSSNLVSLLLDFNQLVGRIPSDIGNLVSLQDFQVRNNKLSGLIPDSIGKLQNLVNFYMDSNMFSGKIPFSIGNLTNLIQFRASQNNLSGHIPSSLGKCENLIALDLSVNNFTGFFPSQLLNLSSLSIYLDLSQNNLSGTLPMEVENLKNLREFDVYGNKLSGEIPNSLGSCISLEILNMYGNHFQGSIPSSLSSLKALQFLDLSKNNLSGEIPEFLSLLHSLLYLNLSYNNLEGLVAAKGIFVNASATDVQGNSMLCGGIPKFHLPPCNSSRLKKNGLTLKLKLVISIISVVLGVILVLGIFLLFWFKQKARKESAAPTFTNKIILDLSYQTLLNATNGFSSDNLIGKGNFGSVYKGTLDAGSTLIAVKVFNLTRHGAFKSFLAECEALRNIRHRNLIKVLTACSSVDYQGNDFKALVYELMINGSLDEWLHPNEGKAEEKKLNILQRINIAIDVACALDYLHNHCQTPIVHCDLKPSNVLLDQELTAQVGDFGLARFLPPEEIHQKSESSSIVRGTVGYAPPEYGMGNEISTGGDVYSYGVLLLQMFTGKRPTHEMFNGDFNLHDMVKLALPNKLVDILDQNLVLETNDARSNKSLECLISIFQIGIDCSFQSPRERMSLPDVIRKLDSIKHKLVGNEIHSVRGSKIHIIKE